MEPLENRIKKKLEEIQSKGLYKKEIEIHTSQQAKVDIEGGKTVMNMCANNYLGFANHPRLIKTGQEALDRWGLGCASVRFICGTQLVHKELESRVSSFLKTEDTILYSSCFDANTGLFESLLTDEDAIISHRLNHASIIDGVRLCKAKRYLYSTVEELESVLQSLTEVRSAIIATDAVFSMDGAIAPLKDVVSCAKRYNALVMADECHGIGACGKTGRGAAELEGVLGDVDIVTGTFGKALGGASGGFTSGKKVVVDYLRQTSRPYLFSNTLAPCIAATAIEAIEMLEQKPELMATLRKNTIYFREQLEKVGIPILKGDHPIIPVMIGDAKLASAMAKKLVEKGVYVVGFSYPVVPIGKARIRVQMSAQFSKSQLEYALDCFECAAKEVGVV